LKLNGLGNDSHISSDIHEIAEFNLLAIDEREDSDTNSSSKTGAKEQRVGPSLKQGREERNSKKNRQAYFSQDRVTPGTRKV